MQILFDLVPPSLDIYPTNRFIESICDGKTKQSGNEPLIGETGYINYSALIVRHYTIRLICADMGNYPSLLFICNIYLNIYLLFIHTYICPL